MLMSLPKRSLVPQLFSRRIDFLRAEIKFTSYPTSLLQTAVHSQASQLSTSQDQLPLFMHHCMSQRWVQFNETALYFYSGLAALIFIHEADRIFYIANATYAVLQWYMFPRVACAPAHVTLGISVPRTNITRVRGFPLAHAHGIYVSSEVSENDYK